MSMSGSLMGYENNNDVHQAKCKKPLKALPVVTSVNAAGVTSTGLANGGIGAGNGSRSRALKSSPRSSAPLVRSSSTSYSRRRGICGRGHVNSLWSVWYGIIAVVFQAYIAMRYFRRFIAFLSLPWPADAPPPKAELHVCLALAGAGVLLLPVLLAAAFLKLGNLANDGIKLGRHVSTCSRDPPSALLNNNTDSSGLASNLWKHGGPTAAFIHLCTAMCFLLPSLLMEARLIYAGFLPKDAIWRTDLDWVMVHRDRLVVLSFMNIPENLNLSLGSPSFHGTSQPYLEDELDETLTNGSSNVDDYNGNSSGNTDTTSLRLFTIPTPPTPANPDVPTSSSFRGSTIDPALPSTSSSSDIDGNLFYPTSKSSTSPSSSSSSGSISSSSSMVNLTPTRRSSSRMNARNAQRNHRPKAKKNWSSVRSKSSQSYGRVGNMSAQSLPLSFNSLADLDRPESLNNQELDETGEEYGPITLEYFNYAMALGVYSVRYPAVFWATNKALGTIFSFQLVANAAQSLLAYAGMSVLYKVQVVGPQKVLSLSRQRTAITTTMSSSSSTISSFLGNRFFLLNPHVTLGLFALSSLLVVICSSMVMYLYAYGRYAMFLNQERERRIIFSKESRGEDTSWTYMTHPAALCVFLAMGICSAPLLYDYSVVYRGSLDGAVLACIAGTLLHLGLWLLVWLLLAIKHRWIFKVRVTIGRATVRSTRSLKLVTDVDLAGAAARANDDYDEDPSLAPLLVLGNGRTYTIAETSPKKAIMSVIQKAAMERKARSQGGTLDSLDGGDSTTDGDEQIYWLRPKLRPSPVQTGGTPGLGNGLVNDKGWLNKKLKQKVTFNDLPSTSGSRNKAKGRRGVADGGPEDDGDYATLRELPIVTAHDLNDDTNSEENKLLECVNDDQVTYYASGNRDLQPSEGEPSPLLLSPEQPLPDPPLPTTLVAVGQIPSDAGLPLPLPPPTPTSHEVVDPTLQQQQQPQAQLQMSSGQTPRCLRRADSGMPHEELTPPRSDSSHSPAHEVGSLANGVSCDRTLAPGGSTTSSNASDNTSSSGVHSSASGQQQQQQQQQQQPRRATSAEDLVAGSNGSANESREEHQWRSCSLQRGTQPPSGLGYSYSGSPSPAAAKFGNPTRANYVAYANHRHFNGEAGNSSNNNNNNNNNTNNANSSNINNSSSGNNGSTGPILESEATVVIRRKNSRPKLQEPPALGEEPFGRSTNMRMTSFTESNDLRASSATLPHYPTQPTTVTYPHCSTMPLPHSAAGGGGGGSDGRVGPGAARQPACLSGSSSSASVSRQYPGGGPSHQPAHGSLPSHTTLPSHHNGVRLMLHAGPNPFVKRFPPMQLAQAWPVLPSLATAPAAPPLHHHGHHTFPQAPQLNGKLSAAQQQQLLLGPPHGRHCDRDSANFSMASSGDSDTCLPH